MSEGTIVAPVTMEERVAVALHLAADQAARDWGRVGWSVVGLAQQALCRR